MNGTSWRLWGFWVAGVLGLIALILAIITGVTGALIGWLNNNGNAVQGAVALVLLFTLVAVLWYALETRKMRLEMQRQGLDSFRPIVDLVLIEPKADALINHGVCITKGEFQDYVDFELSNMGVGPALELEVSLIHPTQVFITPERGGTLPRESMPITIHLKKEVNAPPRSPTPAGSSVVATYLDVYERKWESKRELEFHACKDQFDTEEHRIVPGRLEVTLVKRHP